MINQYRNKWTLSLQTVVRVLKTKLRVMWRCDWCVCVGGSNLDREVKRTENRLKKKPSPGGAGLSQEVARID